MPGQQPLLRIEAIVAWQWIPVSLEQRAKKHREARNVRARCVVLMAAEQRADS